MREQALHEAVDGVPGVINDTWNCILLAFQHICCDLNAIMAADADDSTGHEELALEPSWSLLGNLQGRCATNEPFRAQVFRRGPFAGCLAADFIVISEEVGIVHEQSAR